MNMKMKPDCAACGNRMVWMSAGNNIFLALFKGAVGILVGSRALLADAIHSSSDIICALFAKWATHFSKKPSNKDYPYGYGKIEFVVGIFVGLVLGTVAVSILYDSLKVLFLDLKINPPSTLALWVALLSIYSNFLVSHYTMCAAKNLNSPALKSISVDNRSDAYSSIPVFICILGSQFGLPQLDPIAAAFVGLVILKMALHLVIENHKGLLDAAVKPEVIQKILAIIKSTNGVQGIEYLKTRQSGQKILVDLGIYVDAKKSIEEANAVARETLSRLMRQMRHIGDVNVSIKPVS